MTDAYSRFTDALRSNGRKTKDAGRDRLRAQCPAHDGQGLNLAVARGDQGVLIKCHSHECTEADIARAVGLELRDLFDTDGRAVYDYGDGYQIERRRTPTGKIVRPVAAGITPDVRPLWQPEGADPISTANVVFVCEGEKTADALVRLGAGCVVTWAGGTGGVAHADYSPLSEKHVVIVPDNDEPGQKACTRLREILAPIAADVHVWRVPAHLNDAADLWLEGGDLNSLSPTAEAPVSTDSADADPWAPVDLSGIVDGILDGTLQGPTPEILTRSDGQGIFYRGRVNGVHGDSTAGKTWTALVACVQHMEAGGHALFLDMEDSPAGITGRLIALGMQKHLILERFHYVQVEDSLSRNMAQVVAIVERFGDVFVVVDSVGEALALDGLNADVDADVAFWFTNVARQIARVGGTPLLLDHRPKSGDGELWPIGSQRKRAAITGAQYLQEALSPFSREKAGAARIKCAKDRNGFYAQREVVAVLHVTPNGDGSVRVLLEAQGSSDPSAEFRPTVLMHKVSQVLGLHSEPLTFNGITDRVKGKRTGIRMAVDALIAEGYVTTADGPRGSVLHTSARPFSEDGNQSTTESPVLSPERLMTGSGSKDGNREPVISPVPGTSREPVGTSEIAGVF